MKKDSKKKLHHQSGAEITIDEFLEELHNRGHTVYSINSNESDLLHMQKYDDVIKNTTTVICAPFRKVFFSSRDNFEIRALKLVHEFCPDVIISQLNFLRPLVHYCISKKKPLLYLIHGVHTSGLNSDNDIECLGNPVVKGIICMSQFIHDAIHPSLSDKTKVIYPRIPSSRFITKKLHRRDIVFFNPIQSKGIDIVLKLAKEFNNERFVIKRTWGEVHPSIKNEINIRQNIILEKTESEFSKIYSNCKLLLMPSQKHEELGRGIVEACLNSIPVLASNNGGIPEVATLSDFLVDDYESYVSWRMALKKMFIPQNYTINCLQALENGRLFENRYLENTFSGYIENDLLNT